MKKIKLTCRVLPLVGAMAMVMTSCGGSQQQQMGGGVEAATMTVALSETSLFSEYPAVIKGKVDVQVRPQVSGFITKVCVSEGETVRKGQLLFVIDQVQLQAAVRTAEAQVVSARSNVATCELTEKNKKQLREKNIISDYEYQTAVLALESARAALNQAEQSLINAKKNLSYANVTSPVDGVVGSIPNREGSLAGPSMAPLTTVCDISEVYAYFSLNEKELLNMSNNGANSASASIKGFPEVSLRLANGAIYDLKGKVETISGVIDSSTGSSSVRAMFKNTNNMLRSGSTASVLIPNDYKDVVIIPQGATYEIQDKKFVYCLNDSSVAVATPITVSPVNDGKTYIVTEGLKVGDKVVTEGVGVKVRAGTHVIAKQPEAAAAAPAEEKGSDK